MPYSFSFHYSTFLNLGLLDSLALSIYSEKERKLVANLKQFYSSLFILKFPATIHFTLLLRSTRRLPAIQAFYLL